MSHALIGKYVYLHYLRDRGILSPRKLERWQIPSNIVFGRQATRDGLKAIQEKLDVWLNGAVFPIDFGRREAPHDEHVARVAATFGCVTNRLTRTIGSFTLTSRPMTFPIFPIEVLSIIYEQFLHTPKKEEGESKGRLLGAYYTPIPVVNFMLSELEEHRPLERGMRVFDPACGSGVFLVQAFRRLIEKEYPPSGKRPTPRDLRELLETHFFGIDAEGDACGIAQLGLILTLLDYVLSPRLGDGWSSRSQNLPFQTFVRTFGVPTSFETVTGSAPLATRRLIGSSVIRPGNNLRDATLQRRTSASFSWMKTEEKRRPVGNRQMARALRVARR